MKERSLTSKLMRRFVLFMVVLTIMAIPVLYYITTAYYAEDLTDLVENYGIKNPDIDLEEDTLMGLFIQFMSIIVILFAAVLLVMRYVPQRLWAPFNDTLAKIKGFRVEKGNVPALKKSGTREFDELNATLEIIMSNSVNSYRFRRVYRECIPRATDPISYCPGKTRQSLAGQAHGASGQRVAGYLYGNQAHVTTEP